MKNRYGLKLLLLLIPLGVFSQDIRYSQYYTVMPAINPAATGAFQGDYRLLADYRMSQYSAADPFTTIYASYDQGIKKYKEDGDPKSSFFAAGISFLNDQTGTGSLTSQEISGLLSYNIGVAEYHYLTLGVRASYGSRSVNYSDFKWSTQFSDADGSYDPNAFSDPLAQFEQVTYVPISAGLMWNYANPDKLKINAGVAFNRMNEPNVAFDENISEKLPMQTAVNLGAEWHIPTSIVSLMPLILYTGQAEFSETNLGMFAKFYLSSDSKMTHIRKSSILYTGVFYRTNGDIILAGKIDIRRHFAIGLSYDTNFGAAELEKRGAVEVVLTYSGFFNEKFQLPRKGSTEFF